VLRSAGLLLAGSLAVGGHDNAGSRNAGAGTRKYMLANRMDASQKNNTICVFILMGRPSGVVPGRNLKLCRSSASLRL